MSVDQWSLTKEIKYHYTWTIDNFKNCSEICGEFKESPFFSVGTNDDTKWRLRVYPKGHINSNDFVALYLKLNSCNKTEVIARYVLSIIGREGKQTHLREVKFKKGEVFGYPKYIGRNEIYNLLTEGKLTICCQLTVEEDTVKTSGQGNLVQVNPRGRVLDDFGKLFDEMKFSDVTLVAGGKKIRAHKLILAARSEVFAAMFEHDMQEQKLNLVKITDLDHKTVTEMLRFMYTDRTPNLDEMAADLLAAADKYGLYNLKLLCEEALCRKLSIENATDTLVLADLHSAERLKRQTIAFINSKHLRTVMATEGWKKMTSTHPHLFAELFSKIAVQQEQHLPSYQFSSFETQLCSDVGNGPKKPRLE